LAPVLHEWGNGFAFDPAGIALIGFEAPNLGGLEFMRPAFLASILLVLSSVSIAQANGGFQCSGVCHVGCSKDAQGDLIAITFGPIVSMPDWGDNKGTMLSGVIDNIEFSLKNGAGGVDWSFSKGRAFPAKGSSTDYTIPTTFSDMHLILPMPENRVAPFNANLNGDELNCK
jgi:hypothetical protein